MDRSELVIIIGITFLLGNISAVLGWSIWYATFLMLIGSLTVAIIFERTHFSQMKWVIPLACVIFFAGAFHYQFRERLVTKESKIIYNLPVQLFAEVTTEPTIREIYQEFKANITAPFPGQLKIITDSLLDFKIGDTVEIVGRIEEPEIKSAEAVLFPSTIVIRGTEGAKEGIEAKLSELKGQMTRKFSRMLSNDAGALLNGLTFGVRSGFSGDLKRSMQESGTTHLVALSGYNIAIIIFAIASMLSGKLPRKIVFLITISFIALFVIMVGSGPSIVRAAIMGAIVLLATQIGRLPHVFITTVLTANAMILFDPKILNDIGFQLSFVSLLGILYLTPVVHGLMKQYIKIKDVFQWKELLSLTLAAQIAVIPLVLYHFGSFSITSVFANILILPVVPLVMFLGFLFGTLLLINSYFGFALKWILEFFLGYQLAVIDIFAKWNLPVANDILTWILVLSSYAFLLGIVLRNKHNDTREYPANH